MSVGTKFYNAKHPDYKTLFFKRLDPPYDSIHGCRYIYCHREPVFKCNYCDYHTHRPSTHCGRHYQTYHEIKEVFIGKFSNIRANFVEALIWDKRSQRINKIERLA